MSDDLMRQPIEKLAARYPFIVDYIHSLGISRFDSTQTPETLFAAQAATNLEDFGLKKQELASRFLAYLSEMEHLDARSDMKIHSLSIMGGRDKRGGEEGTSLTLRPGDIVSIVGSTGSGKSRLLADIECLAQGDTPTRRRILIDGETLNTKKRRAVGKRLVAQLSQNMNYVMDLSVREFEKIHASTRMIAETDEIGRAVDAVIATANSLSGEKFTPDVSLTQLSGGQSRALMIADTALLSASPVILIDEIENAGIDRKRALEVLAKREKIVLMATHDPILALMGDKRLIIKNGGIFKIIETTKNERENLQALERIDGKLLHLRDLLRNGDTLDFSIERFMDGTG